MLRQLLQDATSSAAQEVRSVRCVFVYNIVLLLSLLCLLDHKDFLSVSRN